MREPPGRNAPSSGRLILTALVVSALVGGIAGFAFGFLAPRPPGQAPEKREFYLFTDSISFNETRLGVPHDIFSPDRMVVNKGDTVIIHYYNLEDVPENHTFTMTAPYAMNYVLRMNQNVTIQFVVDSPGIFAYRCTLHQPTMTGYIAIIG
jgi:plastocyanin